MTLLSSFSSTSILYLYPLSIFCKFSYKLCIISLCYLSILPNLISKSFLSFFSFSKCSWMGLIYFLTVSNSNCLCYASLKTSSVYYCYCSICSFNYCSTLMCCLTSASSFISIFSYPWAYLSIFFCFSGSSRKLAKLDYVDERRSIFTFSKSLLSFFWCLLLGFVNYSLIYRFSFYSYAFLNFSCIFQFSLNYSNSSILICIRISTDCLM